MAIYPGAKWRPLGAQTERRMARHDVIVLHTMVGYLVSTDNYFRASNGAGYIGLESHFGVAGKWGSDLKAGPPVDGEVWQWQDTAYEAQATGEANYRAVSIETADSAPGSPMDIPPWTPAQCEGIARLLAWLSDVHDIPLTLIPDSRPGRRGVGYHRQGIDPWRVSGGETWSSSTGKRCPGDARIAQIPGILTRARQIKAGVVEQPPLEDGENGMLTEPSQDWIKKVVGDQNGVLDTRVAERVRFEMQRYLGVKDPKDGGQPVVPRLEASLLAQSKQIAALKAAVDKLVQAGGTQ